MRHSVREGRVNLYETFFCGPPKQLSTDTSCSLENPRKRWMIGTNGESDSGKTLPTAQHEAESDDIYINIINIQ